MDETLETQAFAARSGPQTLTVSALNRQVRLLIEAGVPNCWVSGEISNLVRAASGHVYFSLKDEAAQVRCVMFRSRAQLVGWALKNGQHVEARAQPSLYEARGDFQLNVEALRRAGTGSLHEAFARLRARLEAEGLFDPAHKRGLPAHPRAIAVVTSPQAAALRDVLTTLARRAPHVPVILYPTAVQGEGAAMEIVRALAQAGTRGECDLIILCRGGGSIEDLWSFNEEPVVRAVAASPIPVICGVGHETDFTLADFAADRRAPTPTAAAEMAAPERARLLAVLSENSRRLSRHARIGLEARMQRLDLLARSLIHPGERLARLRLDLRHLGGRLAGAGSRAQERRQARLQGASLRLHARRPQPLRRQPELLSLRQRLIRAQGAHLALLRQRLIAQQGHLAHLNPQSILERGYSIARDAEGRIVRDSAALRKGDHLRLSFARGLAEATVDKVED